MIQVQAKIEIIERDGKPILDTSTISPSAIMIKQCVSIFSHNQDKDLVIIMFENSSVAVKLKDVYAAIKAIGG